MGIQSRIANEFVRQGTRLRNKWVTTKDKKGKAKRAIKHAAKTTGRAIQSYQGPDHDPFTGVNLKPWKKQRQQQKKRKKRRRPRKVVTTYY